MKTGEEYIALKDIATRQEISIKYLESITTLDSSPLVPSSWYLIKIK